MKIQSFDMLAPFYDHFIGTFRRRMPHKIMSRLNPRRTDVILDIGGGTGYNSAEIAKRCKQLVVLDISFKMLGHAKKYRHLDLVLGDARMLPFKKGSFDVIMAVDSLHHISDYAGFLEEAGNTGRGKLFVAEFFGRNHLGKLLTGLEKLFFPVVYKKPDQFRMQAAGYGFPGDYEYISSFEYFFLGSLHRG